MKWYLIIGCAFLLCALGAVVGVWVMYQDVHRRVDFEAPVEVNEPVSITEEKPEADISKKETTTTNEPITIDTTTLSETQQKMLATFGYSGTVTITPEMVQCAENAVGKERFDSITNGSAPSPLEATKLLPCFK